MIMLNNTTAVVFDTNDLRDAVNSDNGVEYVYFGADITLGYSITIYPGKPSLIFDGTYKGFTHTFTDMNSLSSEDTIGVRSISNITITFKNINLIGRNFYGIPYVPDNSSYSGVSTIYDKVTYSGIQITHNPYGFARYTDCNITVNNHEVAQISRLEIGGLTTIVKTNQSNAVFWFYGSSTRRPYLRILSDADVTITTEYYFMYEYNPTDYIIEENASFTLNTNSGIVWEPAQTVNSFTVSKNASFRFTQKRNRGLATLYLSGALTVDEGASFYMQADFANNHPLIRFTGRSASLTLNNPRSFALYNRGNSEARAFYFAAQIPFVFVGNQVNRWDVPEAFPSAGTFDDEPRYKWKRPRYDLFKIEGRADNSQTYVDFHSFTPEELGQMSPIDDLKLREAIVFSEGNLPLSVNPVVIGLRRPISGKTAKKARVRVSQVAVDPYPDCDADDDGNFSVMPTDIVPFGEIFSVASNTPFLITVLTVESREQGELSIVDAPEYIRFIPPPMAEFSDTILPRQISEITVTVSDIRAEKTEWVIWVKITGPLRTTENDVLDNAVVFAREDGELITLSTEYSPVYTDGPFPDDSDVPVTWPLNRGILARITVPIRSGRRYSTQLHWTVYPAGVQPGGSD